MTWSSLNSSILRHFFFAVALIGPGATAAPPSSTIKLLLPIDCDFATTCSIQKYVDRAPGPERRDYRCGRLTTDGHDGVDFRLRRNSDIALDVPVLAAAAGKVARVRDGMPDVDVAGADAPAIGDRLAGNAVVIDHGDGWVTQYSHLKRGSVAVAPGQRVAAGIRLGAIGMSGNAEFVHLHFEVRHENVPKDPFAADGAEGCGREARPSLWTDGAAKRLAYRPMEVLAAGFTADARTALAAPRRLDQPSLLADPAALILWGTATGAADGDVQRFRITSPNGDRLLDRESRVAGGGLEWTGFTGVPRPAAGWPTGRYTGSYTLIRNGKIMAARTAVIELK